ncbi:MAG: zf-HC2 domain-containing protein [Bradymonadales bacterium]|nr:zf-HC2 domain-containing protein [Bradymonadales bacterium]
MNCSQLLQFAQAYLDGELDTVDKAEIEAHLASCQTCQRTINSAEGFRLYLKNQAPSVSAPPFLRRQVTTMLSHHSAQSRIRPIWMASALAAAVVLALVVTPRLRPPLGQGPFDSDPATAPFIDASVNWHRRNLPVEVTGPDLSVLGEWFSQQVDFPVRLPSFQHRTIRANLLGGRLSHLQDQDAAHVVYEVDGAKLSVMVYRTPERRLRLPIVPRSSGRMLFVNRSGYNVLLFDNDGISYSVTSALPQSRLRELVQHAAFRNY